MSSNCCICNSQETLVCWVHPVTKGEYEMCSFCKSVVIGVCCDCNAIIHSMERFAIEADERYLCESCAFHKEMVEEG